MPRSCELLPICNNPPVSLRRWHWLELSVAALAVLARVAPGPRTIDDAYITFRYSRNLLQGDGLVYNPGERVLGTTTPIFALLMAGVALPAGASQAEFPELANWVNALADAVTCLILPLLGARLGSRHAGRVTAVLWAIAPWSVTFAIGGLETSLLVALATGTFYLHLSGRPVAAALTGSLALLTRPDSLLFIGPLAGARLIAWRRGEAIRPRELTAFVAPLAVWAVIGLSYYGSPIPHSIFAKAVAYRLPPEAGLVRLLQHYATPFVAHETLGPGWIPVGLVLYPALFLLGALTTFRHRPAALPVLAYPWLYFAAFALANPLLFRWYLTPPLPTYMLVILIGVFRIARDVKTTLPAYLFSAAAVALTANAWTLQPDHGPTRPAPKMAFIQLELLYQETAERLRSDLQPGQVLAAADIGALGYYTEAPILDLLGLISPTATAYYPTPESIHVINYAVPPELVHDLQPEFLVLLEAYVRRGLLLDPTFQVSYRQIELLPTDIYGSRGMLVFQRATDE